MTTTYVKKPIVVEAVQFTDKNKNQVYSWAREIQNNVTAGQHELDSSPYLNIQTLEGIMTCNIGDWLIIEPFPTDWRKLYPVKDKVFHQTYILS